MLSKEENRLLTEVGPGTPCGEVLRRYWMPVCPAAELTAETPKKRMRLLGEDLVLFRDGKGRLGLVAEQCPHRRISLYHGFVEDDGLRCAYHGWKFAVDGTCIEQPFERATEASRAAACQKSYPVQQLAGILFAYLGPLPAPLLPRWETLVRTDGTRKISVLPLHRNNWLQAQENSVDPVHTYYLHSHMFKMQKHHAPEASYYDRPIEDFDFELCREATWAGVRKSRVYGGDRPEREVGHPAVFPNILMNPQGERLATQWRVPADDRSTHIIWCEFTPSADGAAVDQRDADIPVVYLPDPRRDDGEYDLTSFPAQDQMAWETQGPIVDRSAELLGRSDRGIVMFRNLLKQQIEAVQSGKDPVGVIRDPVLNEIITFAMSQGQAQMVRKVAAAE
jgi:5,5'-dehydrodivanillate O-demethylase oxygenase subunit